MTRPHRIQFSSLSDYAKSHTRTLTERFGRDPCRDGGVLCAAFTKGEGQCMIQGGYRHEQEARPMIADTTNSLPLVANITSRGRVS
jgi:hypothetical protein